MGAITPYKGIVYRHSDYATAAKRKNLPEPVKKAIMGKDYVEPIQVDVDDVSIETSNETEI